MPKRSIREIQIAFYNVNYFIYKEQNFLNKIIKLNKFIQFN